MSQQVVLIHGFWMTGLELYRLGRFLKQQGYQTVFFRYPSFQKTPSENAKRLQQFLQKHPAKERHFIAHSLGGIVLAHLFHQFPMQPTGKAILLGSPIQGSAVARRLNRWPLLRLILGRSGEQGLFGGAPAWPEDRELGVVVGRLGLGIGLVIGGVQAPHDGVVNEQETWPATEHARLIMETNHLGLPLSAAVAKACVLFLQTGHFQA